MKSARDDIENLYALLNEFTKKHSELAQQVKAYRERYTPTFSLSDALSSLKGLISSNSASSAPDSSTPLLGAKPIVIKEKTKEKEKETTAKLDRWLTPKTTAALTKAAQISQQFIIACLEEQATRKQVESVLKSHGEKITSEFIADMKTYENAINQAKSIGPTMLKHMQHLVSLYPTLATYAENLSAIVEEASIKTTTLEENVVAFQAKNLANLLLQQLAGNIPDQTALDALPISSFKSELDDLEVRYINRYMWAEWEKPHTGDPLQQQMDEIPANSTTILADLVKKLTDLKNEYNSAEWQQKSITANEMQTDINSQRALDFTSFNKHLTGLIKPLLNNKKEITSTLAEIESTFDEMLTQLMQQVNQTSTTIKQIELKTAEIPAISTPNALADQELIDKINALNRLYVVEIKILTNANRIATDSSQKNVMLLIDRFRQLISEKTFSQICTEAQVRPDELRELGGGEKARKVLVAVIDFIKNTRTHLFDALEKIQQTNQAAEALASNTQLLDCFENADRLMSAHESGKLTINYSPEMIGHAIEQAIKSVVNHTNNFSAKWLTNNEWNTTIEKAVTTHYQAQQRYETLTDITTAILNQFRLLKDYLPVISINDSAEYAPIVAQFNELIDIAQIVFNTTKVIIDNEQLKSFLRAARDKITTPTTAYTLALQDGFQAKLTDFQPAVAEVKAYEKTVEKLNREPAGSNTRSNNMSIFELFATLKETASRLLELKIKTKNASNTIRGYIKPVDRPLANFRASLQDIKTQWLDRALSAFETEYKMFKAKEVKEHLLVEECERWLPAFIPNAERLAKLNTQIGHIHTLNSEISSAKDHHDKMALQLSTQLNAMLAQVKTKLATTEQLQRLIQDMKIAVFKSLNKFDPENPISRAYSRIHMGDFLDEDSQNWRLINKLVLGETITTPSNAKHTHKHVEQITKINTLQEIFPEEIFNMLAPLCEIQQQVILELNALEETRNKDFATLSLHNQNIKTLNALVSTCTNNMLIPGSDPIALSSSPSIPSIKYQPLPFDSLSLKDSYIERIKQLNDGLTHNKVSPTSTYDFATFMLDLENTLQNNQDPSPLLTSSKAQLKLASGEIVKTTGLLQQATPLRIDKIPHLIQLNQQQTECTEQLSILRVRSENLKQVQTEKIKKLQHWTPMIIKAQKDNPLSMLKVTATSVEKIQKDWKEAVKLAELKYVTASDPAKIANLSASIRALSKKLKKTAFSLKATFIQHLDACDTTAEQEAKLWDFYFIEMGKIEALFLWLFDFDAAIKSLQEPMALQKTSYETAFKQFATWNDDYASPFLQEYQHILDEDKHIADLDDAIRQLENDKRQVNDVIDFKKLVPSLMNKQMH